MRIDYVYKICTKKEWNFFKEKKLGMDQIKISRMALFIYQIENK